MLRLNYPMEHGVVNDWNDMEEIWVSPCYMRNVFINIFLLNQRTIYGKDYLNIQMDEHAVLLTEVFMRHS